jgi:hypothetical protein
MKILVSGVMQCEANSDSQAHEGKGDRRVTSGIVPKKSLCPNNSLCH